MPEIYGRPRYIHTMVEKTLLTAGSLRLLYNGNATGSKVFTREYELIVDGKPTELKIKFVYDYINDRASLKFREWHLALLNIALDKAKPKPVPPIFIPKNNKEWVKSKFRP